MNGLLNTIRFFSLLLFCLLPAVGSSQTTEEREKLDQLQASIGSAYQQGQFELALSLSEQAIDLAVSAFPTQDRAVSRLLQNHATLLIAQGRADEARPHLETVFELFEENYGLQHIDTARSIASLAIVYEAIGNYDEAEQNYKLAQSLFESLVGQRADDTLRNSDNYATFLQSLGRYDEAEKMSSETLHARVEELGAEHPETIISIGNLGALYYATGRFSEAEVLISRALALSQRTHGAEHPNTLIYAHNLAVFWQISGRIQDALELHLNTARSRESVLGFEHPDTIASLKSIAALYQELGEFSQAEDSFLLAIRVSLTVLGPSHPDTLVAIYNLAHLYSITGKQEEAEELYLHTLGVTESTLGRRHPNWLNNALNLGELYLRDSRSLEAEELLREVTKERRSLLGSGHPDTVVAEVIWARALLLKDDLRSAELVRSNLNNAIDAQSARLIQQLNSGANDALRQVLIEDSGLRDIAVSAALADETYRTLAARALLLTKGASGETDAALSRLVATDPRIVVKQAAEALRLAEGRLHASYQTQDTERISDALSLRDDARNQLFELVNPPLAFVPGTIHTTSIIGALKENTVFLDYGIFSALDFGSGEQSEPHILVVAYRPGKAVELFDLGPVAQVSRAILSTTDYLSNRVTNLSREHWELSTVLLDPIKELLVDADEIIVSPDGILARVNFGLLQDPDQRSRHLLERLPVRVVPSGRSLLDQNSKSPEPIAQFLGAGLTNFGPYDPNQCVRTPQRDSNGGLCPLDTPVYEVEGIAKLFDDANQSTRPPLLETGATEAAVTDAMPGTRLIHLATHGGAQLAGFSSGGLHSVGLAFHGIGDRQNPNRIITAENDGILSGYEAARLRLWGTDLVVMSACDTALGENAGAEGIWSMAYSFRLAGVNTVMMTLWAVDDAKAPDFMIRFYTTLLERQTKEDAEDIQLAISSALRDTQLWAMGAGWSYWEYGPYVLVES